MKKVYICSPLRGDIEKNINRAIGYCREAIAEGHLPIAPHVYFTRFLDDNEPAERALGLRFGWELLRDCEELWVYGDPSEGMLAEIWLAYGLGIAVKRKRGVKDEL